MTGASDWFDRYKFCQPLGQGGMGTVYLAEDRANNNVQCVIKQLHNKYSDPVEQAEAVRLFKREAKILRSLNHSGIVRVFDDYTTNDGRYFLVMDYIKGKTLDTLLNIHGLFTSEQTVRIAIQCCEILEYLHGLDPPVIYRDCKPSNLMLSPDGHIVFIDFGIARSFTPKEAATRVVTAGYSPPEQYFGRPETRSDLYSMGATMFHLLTGKRPKPLSTCEPKLHNSLVNMTLDTLIKRLTAHNVEERPPSARAVKFQLYKIYKELHPEFEFPQAEKTECHSSIDSLSNEIPSNSKLTASHKSTTSAIKAIHNQFSNNCGVTPKHKRSPLDAKQTLALQDLTIWQRFKRWLQL